MTTKELVVKLAKEEPHKYTYRQAAEKLGIKYKTLRNAAAEENLCGFFISGRKAGGIISKNRSLTGGNIMDELNDSQIREVVHAEQKAKIAHEKHSFTERKYKLLMQEHERVVTELEQLTQVSNGNVNPMDIKPRKTKKENEAVPCLVWSDWHSEERVDPRSIGGKNRFSLDIAQHRATHVAQSSLKLIQEDDKRVLINDVAIFLLGDFITGNIHEENVENAQLQPVEAALFAQGMIEGAIDFMLANTKYNLNVYCKVGNHSRITHKVHVSTEFGNSLELAMYVSMMKRYRDRGETRVSFHIEPSYYSIVNILGTRVRFHHGHAVSYGGGVGGLHIPLRKAIKSWNETVRADFDIMGHYHSFLEHSTMRYLVNGSLIGYNAYAERVKAVIEPPIQGYCLIHKKYGVTRMTPVFAE